MQVSNRKFPISSNGTASFKNVKGCFNTNIYSNLEKSGGQSSNLYINVVHFLTLVLIKHLWHLKTVVFLHCQLIHGVPLPLPAAMTSFKVFSPFLKDKLTC
jgi:hypothetical protein